jgi:hypothetical protein
MCVLWTVSSYMTWQITPRPSTAHGNRQLTFRRNLVRQLIDTFASRKRTGRKRSSPIGTAFPNLFHFLQKVSGRAKVCVSSVTFHCAVWDVFWNTTNSEMWRCKIRLVGYHIHKFITNKMKKSYHSAFFSLIVMIFFFSGRETCFWCST